MLNCTDLMSQATNEDLPCTYIRIYICGSHVRIGCLVAASSIYKAPPDAIGMVSSAAVSLNLSWFRFDSGRVARHFFGCLSAAKLHGSSNKWDAAGPHS